MRGRARARRAHRRLARVDGSRRLRRRPAARRGGRGDRRDPRRHRAPCRRRCTRAGPGARVQIAVAPCSPFSVTRPADGGVGGARAPARPAAAHPSRRDGRGGRLLPRALRLHARSSTSAGSAGSTPTSGARTASTSRPPTCARFAETGTGVAHCPTSNMRLGAGIAPVRAMLDAGVRVGLGVDGSASNERGDLFGEVKQALMAARAVGGPTALTAREALRLGDPGRRRRAASRRHRLARAGQAGRLRRLAHGRARARRRRRPRRRPRLRRRLTGSTGSRRRRGRRARRRARPRRRSADRKGSPGAGAKVHSHDA